MSLRGPALAWLLLCALCAPASAHEFDPALLDLREITEGAYLAHWTVPAEALAARPHFGESCRAEIPVPVEVAPRRYRSAFELRCSEGGVSLVEVRGLGPAADALIRLTPLKGAVLSAVVRGTEPSARLSQPAGTASGMLWIGVEHILWALDHLLFVLGLVLLTRGAGLGRLLATVTAFTVGHSLTLALAVLGYVHLPSAPVEATIALSILLLAVELMRNLDGPSTWSARYPWLIAGLFGLVHGLGFAGALVERGLPSHELPIALLMFNLGVELGQLAFVSLLLLLGALAARVRSSPPEWALPVATYGMGAFAAAWTFERISAML